MSLKFHFQQEPWSGALAVRMAQRVEGNLHIARNIEFRQAAPAEYTEPLFKLSQEEAQALADGLYEAGVRPSAAAGSAGQLAAVQYHLEDMRSLVFEKGKP